MIDLVPKKYHLWTFVSNTLHIFPSTNRSQAEKRRRSNAVDAYWRDASDSPRPDQPGGHQQLEDKFA